MEGNVERTAAAELFKTLGNESRLALLLLLRDDARTVSSLVAESGLSQPLVSQHLRTLRGAGLVSSHREGREVEYRLADHHVLHVISDALFHVTEPAALHSDRPEEEGEER
ncbi:hypothetical protein GCM10009808_11040 [Microbacterium sediminicola]|uniref:HTH arsR-type domain-containing protein n=1 Tax=Microbacterium sediminicola TaxID=415210 RepID=A0ABN2HYE7_9MICO